MLIRTMVSLVATVLFVSTVSLAEGQRTHTIKGQTHTISTPSHTIKGRVVTGTNRFLGQALTDFGASLGTAGFTNIASYDSNGDQPVLLTPDTSLEALLVTYVDPVFLNLIGKTPAEVDPSKLNILLQDVPVNVDPAGRKRLSLDSILQSRQTQPSLAEPSSHITLSDWVRAEGFALIKCQTASSSTVAITLKKFLPNRLYTVWGILGGDELMPLPLGGVPNAIITDRHGDARFERVLNFCPYQTGPGERPLMLIDIVFHSDHQTYGAIPDLPFANLFTGTINHTQYEFQIMGTSLLP